MKITVFIVIKCPKQKRHRKKEHRSEQMMEEEIALMEGWITNWETMATAWGPQTHSLPCGNWFVV